MNSLQSELNNDEKIMTGQYMEPMNERIKALFNWN